MLELILSSVQAIMQVMTIVFAGTLLATYGYIDDEQQKWLSRLNMVFFTPCLLFVNIASVVSLERLLNLWPVPAFYITFMFISWIFCQTVSPLFDIDKHQKRFVLACTMFSNANSLPVAIISGLAISEAGKSLYREVGDSQAIVAARWSFGFNLLRKESKDEEEVVADYTSIISHVDSATLTSYGSIRTSEKDSSPLFRKAMKYIQGFMSPPLYAAILAFLVGLCNPLKSILYNKDSFFYVSFTHAIESCGKASVPIVLICLGAQLKTIRQVQGTISNKVQQTVKATLLIRVFLVPLCIIPIIYAFSRLKLDLAKDPVFIVSMVIAGCMPTSINLAQITQANRAFQDEMLHVLFWSYGVACIPLCTFIVFAALYIVKELA
ncbi:hypothetical protein G6F46_002165 [Rhizopus delemar]|nr:hypothetical protein G6F55_009474 [Rhizopus delemar]KAG1552153.1 hypothetical protein G6F51_001403 [Rhizopus arrhizus]KAG1500440.1 hypothetical protein G6F54_003714 [Rhizopus delemar]KAG1507877.1 hypothetical protein G6F52_011526 [Rhizopus delemar]KAG1517737.1 hypothetical protein G6F53_001136 [Rhizopus delemar]